MQQRRGGPLLRLYSPHAGRQALLPLPLPPLPLALLLPVVENRILLPVEPQRMTMTGSGCLLGHVEPHPLLLQLELRPLQPPLLPVALEAAVAVVRDRWRRFSRHLKRREVPRRVDSHRKLKLERAAVCLVVLVVHLRVVGCSRRRLPSIKLQLLRDGEALNSNSTHP